VRLTDFLFRQGHLSEASLIQAVTGHERPPHLDRCDECAQRAAHLTDWLSEAKATGLEVADLMFSDEKLKVQRSQILARLAHEDQPSRIIAFPRRLEQPMAARAGLRVSPGWIGVAAAAGIVLGLIGGQITARMSLGDTRPTSAVTSGSLDQTPANLLLDSPTNDELNQYTPEVLSGIDEMLPALVVASTQGG
jgi:hypothetical protein